MDAVPGTPSDTHELHQHIINTDELLWDQAAARDGSQELNLSYCYSFLNMFIEPSPAVIDTNIEMGAGSGTEFRCTLCKKTFKQKSSLVRHVKKCTLEPKLSVRQKACRQGAMRSPEAVVLAVFLARSLLRVREAAGPVQGDDGAAAAAAGRDRSQ
ncbi:hypothetical protein F5X99DRAFT_408356 [Biscogniauxia marginata]|nr:hypothetical protein F5X99DRAFT_408356 [Biscogniauxia marginata]